MIGLTFPKELMLMKQVHQKECDICHYWYFLNYILHFNQMSRIDAMIY